MEAMSATDNNQEKIVTDTLTVRLPVQYNSSEPVAYISFDDFESDGNAEPTNRVLDGSSDHGYAEEWAEPGYVVIDSERRPANLIYLFEANECADDAENYPWDPKHAARIILRD